MEFALIELKVILELPEVRIDSTLQPHSTTTISPMYNLYLVYSDKLFTPFFKKSINILPEFDPIRFV